MSNKINNICRTCLALDGILSIFDTNCSEGNSRCIAGMLNVILNCDFEKNDGMPDKVCLICISEINRFYSFKMKCTNSDNTLRKILNISNEREIVEASESDISSQLHFKIDSNLENKNKDENHPSAVEETEIIQTIDQSAELSLEEDDEIKQGENEGTEEKVEKDMENEATGFKISEENTNNLKSYQDCSFVLTKGKRENETKELLVYEGAKVEKHLNGSDARSANFFKLGKLESKSPKCPMSLINNRNLKKHIATIHNHSIEMCPTEKQLSENNCFVLNISNSDSLEIVEEESEYFHVGFEDKNEEFEFELIEIEDNVSKRELRDNCQNDENPHDEKLCCPRCGALFALLSSLNIHIKMNKCTNVLFPCTICKKVFVSQKSLKKHMKTHEFICEFCGENFNNEYEHIQHRAEHEGVNYKNQCPKCKKVFTMRSTLKDHMRIHTGEKPFVCDVCGKAFNQNANLKQHVMRHNKTKPFNCNQCQNSFVSKGELDAHLRTHSGDQPFQCDYCTSAFTTSSSLVKHKRTHTGERPYSCEFCPMRFTALNTLKNHRRTHTGEKPYKCKYCSRAFAQKSDCNIHMRTHTGERRHICHMCGTKFQQTGALKTHMKTHKNEDKHLDLKAGKR